MLCLFFSKAWFSVSLSSHFDPLWSWILTFHQKGLGGIIQQLLQPCCVQGLAWSRTRRNARPHPIPLVLWRIRTRWLGWQRLSWSSFKGYWYVHARSVRNASFLISWLRVACSKTATCFQINTGEEPLLPSRSKSLHGGCILSMAVDLTGRTVRLRWRKKIGHTWEGITLEQPRERHCLVRRFSWLFLFILPVWQDRAIFSEVYLHVSPRYFMCLTILN